MNTNTELNQYSFNNGFRLSTFDIISLRIMTIKLLRKARGRPVRYTFNFNTDLFVHCVQRVKKTGESLEMSKQIYFCQYFIIPKRLLFAVVLNNGKKTVFFFSLII